MNSRYASGKLMSGIKKCGIAIGYLRGEREQFGRHLLLLPGSLAVFQKLNCLPRPASPMTEQPARETYADSPPCRSGRIRGKQVEHDVVVIAGVERDFTCPSGFGNCMNHVECLIP